MQSNASLVIILHIGYMYLRGVALYAIHAVTLTTFEVYQIQRAVSKWRQGVRRKGIVSVGTNS